MRDTKKRKSRVACIHDVDESADRWCAIDGAWRIQHTAKL